MTASVIAIQTWLSAQFAGQLLIEHTLHRADAETPALGYTNFLIQRRKNMVQHIRFAFRDDEVSIFVVLFVIHKAIPRPDIEHTRSRIVTLRYADPQLFEQLESTITEFVLKCRKDLPE